MDCDLESALGDVPHHREPLGCYSALYTAEATVLAPRDVRDLRRIFLFAKECGRRITFRSGGHSFDEQAMNDDLVVLMTSLRRVELDVTAGRLTAEAGATWGDVLDRIEPHGFVPYSTVTTRHATCGGTLSGDCLSRFSPAYGKEGIHILAFDFLMLDGTLVTCTAPAEGSDPSTWTLPERIFCGAISGFGYLGAVIRITYELLYVGQTDGKIGVKSSVHKFRTYRELAEHLVPHVRELYENGPKPHLPESIFSALFMSGKDKYALVLHSRYTDSPDRRRLPIHQPDAFFRVVAEIALRSSLVNQLTWPIFYRLLFHEKTTYIDDLAGFLFFMDGNRNAKELGESLGFPMRSIQQTFVIPAESPEKGWHDAHVRLAKFLEDVHAKMDGAGVFPTLFDVLFLPKDSRFLLSPSVDLAGFAVSYAFETSNEARLAKVKALFEDVSDMCLAAHGRVSLVKNVHVRPTTLRKMYEPGLLPFFALKRVLDPSATLRNHFLERNFGDLLTVG